MRSIFIAVALTLLYNSVHAQWRKIADFGGESEYITCVYFLDLPGPPRIGFVGTGTNLYKTTDGGNTWTKEWGTGYYSLYYVTDICFKDSMTGWFTVFGDTDACYRTTDGGSSWEEILSSPYGGLGIYYSQKSSSVFLSLADDSGMRYSSDLGNTWKPIIDTETGGISFFSDLIGIATAYPPYPDTASSPDTNYGFFHTSDGGLTWHFLSGPFSKSPLSVVGSATCFAATQARTSVWRSDNYGGNWRKIADFGSLLDSIGNQLTPYCTGYIKGNLRRLSIQTDSGMYVSTDSGVTWRNDGGPSYITNFSNDNFYSAKGVTIAGMTYSDGAVESGGLWEETWPQSGVTPSQSISAANISVYPNPTAGLVTITGASGPVEVENVLGESVMRNASCVTRNGNVELDLSPLPAGTYFVRAMGQDGQAAIRRVAKE